VQRFWSGRWTRREVNLYRATPTAVGENRTRITVLSPGARVVGNDPATIWNVAPVTVAPLMTSASLPTLRS